MNRRMSNKKYGLKKTDDTLLQRARGLYHKELLSIDHSAVIKSAMELWDDRIRLKQALVKMQRELSKCRRIIKST
jgi:hypothetical protein